MNSGERRFVDEKGRERLFHGVNAVVKGPPYLPLLSHFDVDLSLSEKDFIMFQQLGLNAVRLGTMWPGVEPEEGKYNATYLSTIDKIAKLANKYGVYILYDMHQDVLSAQYCGEGVPKYVVDNIHRSFPLNSSRSFPFPVAKAYAKENEMGFPTRQDCQKEAWGNYYFAEETSKAFQQLYNNATLLDRWGKFWQQVATIAKSNINNTLGLELINEPWSGDWTKYPELMVPGVADKRNLQPAYDALSPYITSISEELLVFFAAVTWDDIVPVGFEHAPGNRSANSVFAFHWYAPPQDAKTRDIYFHQRMSDAKRLKTGAMLTETGGLSLTSNYTSDTFIKTVEEAEKHLLSWMQWEWKPFCKETPQTLNSSSIWAEYGACITGYGANEIWDKNGNENKLVMSKLARSFAYAVSGTTTKQHFDATSAEFTLEYKIDLTIQAPTLLFLQEELNYPNGFDVLAVRGSITFSSVTLNNYALNPTSSTKQNETIEIRIKRK